LAGILKDVVNNVEALCLKLLLFQSWIFQSTTRFIFSTFIHTWIEGLLLVQPLPANRDFSHGSVWTAY